MGRPGGRHFDMIREVEIREFLPKSMVICFWLGFRIAADKVVEFHTELATAAWRQFHKHAVLGAFDIQLYEVEVADLVFAH